MVVAELIELLKNAPQDAVVLQMGSDEDYYVMDDIEVEQMHNSDGYYSWHYVHLKGGCSGCERNVPLVTVVRV